MNKLKVKLLINKYKHEISKGNNKHLNDLIALMVILDLSYLNDITSINITLGDLMNWPFRKVEKYEVPSMEKINLLKKKYKKELKNVSIPFNYIRENAATTWIEMMISAGMIREGEIINPTKIKLINFITDQNIIAMFNTKDISIANYVTPFEQKRKK